MSRLNRNRAVGVLVAALAVLSLGTAAAASLSTRTAVAASQAGAPLVVRVDSGQVRGMVAGPTREFLGVSYAQPPVGALRWVPGAIQPVDFATEHQYQFWNSLP